MKIINTFRKWRDRRSRRRRQRDNRRALRRRKSHVADTVQVLGWDQVEIGSNCVLSEGCWLNVNDRSSSEVAIRIGDNSFIGRRNFFSAGSLIEVGPYCLTGVDCHFLGADHRHDDPFVPYVITGVTEPREIRIGANCWLGSSVTILKNVRVGYGCVIGAGAVVTKDIPPLSVVIGAPARVIKRFDLTTGQWLPIAQWREHQLPDEAEYCEILRSRHPRIKLPVVAAGPEEGDL